MLRLDLERTQDERKVRIVRDHRLRKGRELNVLAGQLFDFADYPFDRSLPAIQDRAELYSGGTHYVHCRDPSFVSGAICRVAR